MGIIEFKKIKSKVEQIESIQNIIKEIGKYKYALVVKYSSVNVVLAKTITNIQDVIELRAFDDDGELHIVKCGENFKGRVRIDNSGIDTEYTEEYQKLWGKTVNASNNISYLHDDRGINLEIPINSSENDKIYIKVIHYFDNEKLEFSDYRLCGIYTQKEIQNG